MARTKKVLSTGKYGVRYGKKIRERLLDVEKDQRKRHACPQCLKLTFKRQASGIWSCGKCGAKYAGKAYKPA